MSISTEEEKPAMLNNVNEKSVERRKNRKMCAGSNAEKGKIHCCILPTCTGDD